MIKIQIKIMLLCLQQGEALVSWPPMPSPAWPLPQEGGDKRQTMLHMASEPLRPRKGVAPPDHILTSVSLGKLAHYIQFY